MMCYKDQTFCNNWCATISCFRNYIHIENARADKLIEEWMPICFFTTVPIDCKEWTPIEPEAA